MAWGKAKENLQALVCIKPTDGLIFGKIYSFQGLISDEKGIHYNVKSETGKLERFHEKFLELIHISFDLASKLKL